MQLANSVSALSPIPAFGRGQDHFFPDAHIVGLISDGAGETADCSIVLPGSGALTIHAGRRECSVAVAEQDMPHFLSAHRDDFRLMPVPADTPAARCMRLEDLLWSAGYLASRGRMVAGGSLLDVVRIARWPNFSRLPCSLDTMRMVALLTRHPTSIALATRILDIRQDEACRVYSAATCAGLVEVLNRRPATGVAGDDVSTDAWESGAQFAAPTSDRAEACPPAAAHELVDTTVVQPALGADDAHAASAGPAAVDANPPARRGRRDTLLGQLLARIMGL